MGFLNRIFGKSEAESEEEQDTSMNLAFILLSEARLPDAEAVAAAFREFAAAGEELSEATDDSDDGRSDQVTSLALNTGETSFVALMPAAVPDGEADQGVQYSLSRFKDNWTLPPHHAHLLVTFFASEDSTPVVRLSRFTSVVAAITKVSPAVGVYWGSAGATHDSEFFTSVAAEREIAPRMMLWSGMSIARDEDGRLSLLSLGMGQLGLPDLLLVAGEASESIAIETMYDLLFYVADRGEPLPDGDTVGRTSDEHLPVHYVKSPVDPKKKVWQVELP